MPIQQRLVLRRSKPQRLTIQEMDDNVQTQEAISLSSNNSVIYSGPFPEGITASYDTSSTTTDYRPLSGRFSARIPYTDYNPFGETAYFYLPNGMTFSFRFSATASFGATAVDANSWWGNLSSSYTNKILSVSDIAYPANMYEYKISSMNYNATQSVWNVETTKVSGPTISYSGNFKTDFLWTRGYVVGYRTIQPINTSFTYGWSASIPMVNRNFPFTIGTMTPNKISNPNYLVKVTSASVQFVGVNGVATQVNPTFAINLNTNLSVDSYTETLATATFSGTYSQNRTYRLRPTGLMMEGGSVLYLSSSSYTSWGGITFSGVTGSTRINIFLTYTLFDKVDTGLVDEVA
jgi:hypothetical protein